MKSLILKQAERFLREQKNYKRWLAVFLCLAVAVTIGTAAALKYQGIAVTTDNEEVHVHTDECYEERKVLICGMEEGEGAEESSGSEKGGDAEESSGSEEGGDAEENTGSGSGGHVHDESCYTIIGGGSELSCGMEEHTHGDECYTETEETTELTCGMEEGEGAEESAGSEEGEGAEENAGSGSGGHVHSESCYTTTGGGSELSCGKEEHTHSDECYTESEGTRELSCGMEEGEGAEESADSEEGEDAEESADSEEGEDAEESAGSEDDESEGNGGHVHDESCYKIEKVLICEIKTAEDTEDEEPEEKEEFQSGELIAQKDDYEVTVTYEAEAEIPEGAELKVEEIEKDSDRYKECYEQMLEAMPEGWDDEGQEIAFARFFDISILADGEELEPETGVTVRIKYADAVIEDEQNGFAVHFPKAGGTEIIDADVSDCKDFTFDQSSFSVTGTSATTEAPREGELSAEGDGYTVTVTYGKDAGISGSCTLEASEIEDDRASVGNGYSAYGEYFNRGESVIEAETGYEEGELDVFGRVLELSVNDKNGEPLETKGEVEVKIEFDSPMTAENAGIAAMVSDIGGEGTILYQTEVVEGDEIAAFSGRMSFSAQKNAVTALMAGKAEEYGGAVFQLSSGESRATGTHNFKEEWLTGIPEVNNEWQIVDGRYEGNDVGNKPVKNDNVRLQKNVIPTGVENEFLVYLSIDVKTTVSEQIDTSAIKAFTHFAQREDGTVTNLSSEVTVHVGGTGTMGNETVTFVDSQGNPLDGFENINLGWDNSNNFILVYEINGTFYQLGDQSIKKGSGPYREKLSDTLIEAIKKVHKETSILENVTDEMGQYITCEGILGGDFQTCSVSEDKKTLSWTPSVNPNCETTEVVNGEFWNLNAAQLVYRAKLDVTAEGFQSCAQHMTDGECANLVNNKAVLTYEDGEAEFPKPTVRGLLYDILLKKVDEDTKAPLPGAEFTLVTSGEPVTGISDKDGVVRFSNLPWGTYTLKEIKAPEGYAPVPEGGKEISAVTVCYTTEPGNLTPDVSPYEANMVYKGGDGAETEGDTAPDADSGGNSIVVTNRKIPPVKVVKVWDDSSNIKGLRPDEVKFNIKYRKGTEDFVNIPAKNDESGNVVVDGEGCVTLTGANAVKDPSASGTSDRWELIVDGLPDADSYRVTEVLPENSVYQPKAQAGGTESGNSDGIAVETTEELKVGEDGDKTISIKVYTVSNELKKQPIELVKVEKGSNPEKLLKGAEFELYIKTKADYEAENPKISPWQADGQEKAAKISDDNGVIFTGELEYGEYWLVETGEPENYKKPDAPYVLKVSRDEEGRDSIELSYKGTPVADSVETELAEGAMVVKIPNETTVKKVEIWKKAAGTGEVSEGGQENPVMLGGAEFTVYYTADMTSALTWPEDWQNTQTSAGEEIETWQWQSADAPDKGRIIDITDSGNPQPVSELKAGRYMIEETKAPGGYNKPLDPIQITVNTNGVAFADGKGGSVTGSGNDGEYKIYIDNSAGIELPETGGPGVMAYTFGGLALMATALVYGFSMRRKRGRGGYVGQ